MGETLIFVIHRQQLLRHPGDLEQFAPNGCPEQEAGSRRGHRVPRRPHQGDDDRPDADGSAGLADDGDIHQEADGDDAGNKQPADISQRFDQEEHKVAFATLVRRST